MRYSFAGLEGRFRSVDPAHLAELVEVWGEELHLIIERILDLARTDCEYMHIRARSQVIFELAQLLLYLEDRIVTDRTSEQPIEDLEPSSERVRVHSPAGLSKIENTAQICFKHIWKPRIDRIHAELKLVQVSGARTRQRSLKRKGSFVREQHFSPRSANKYWASDRQKRVRVYELDTGLALRSRDVGYRTWARESFIYSQALEQHLGLVEGDGATQYRKLVASVPLSEQDVRHWVAYLAAQALRTPGFILGLVDNLTGRGLLEIRRDADLFKRSHASMFTSARIFTAFYSLITSHRWQISVAPNRSRFIRADEPVHISRSAEGVTLVYPLTPRLCFVVGPEDGKLDVVPDRVTLDEPQVAAMNFRLASAARKSVIGEVVANDAALRETLEPALHTSALRNATLNRESLAYWGPLAKR